MAAVVAAVACAWPFLSHADSVGDIEAGRALFMQKGCYECHGIFGQGSISTGPALAPNPIPLPAMEAYVHDPKGQMPPFSAKILPDDDISKIRAYLASIPPNPSVDSIALLNNGKPSASATNNHSPAPQTPNPLAHGASIYTANCAACHGQTGEGGVGPALTGVSGRYPVSEIEARIRDPRGIMPRLYPKPLSAGDVKDVARYVASLK